MKGLHSIPYEKSLDDNGYARLHGRNGAIYIRNPGNHAQEMTVRTHWDITTTTGVTTTGFVNAYIPFGNTVGQLYFNDTYIGNTTEPVHFTYTYDVHV